MQIKYKKMKNTKTKINTFVYLLINKINFIKNNIFFFIQSISYLFN